MSARPPRHDPDPLDAEEAAAAYWLRRQVQAIDRSERDARLEERNRAIRDLVLLAIAAVFIVLAVAAASRSAQTTSAGDLSRPRSAEQSEAPLAVASSRPDLVQPGGASPSTPATDLHPSPATSTPEPTTDIATAIAGGRASWCAPRGRQCTRWGGHALLGAVPSFRWGDRPYTVRVRHGQAHVDVLVVSYCACPKDRIIDLSPWAFRKLAPLWRGVITVSVEDLR